MPRPRLSVALPGLAIVATILAALVTRAGTGAFSSFWNFDPSYTYLLNALCMVEGFTPGHTDHPGTTVQEIGAIVILLVHAVRAAVGQAPAVVEDVLRHPELYLDRISDVLIGLLALAMGLVTRQLLKRAGQPLLAALFLLLFLTSGTLVETLRQVQPEPLQAALAILATLLAWPSPDTAGRRQTMRAVALGAVLGTAVVTKITSLPLILLLVAVPSLSMFGVAVLAALAAIAVLSLPIVPALPDMYMWQRDLLFHSGRYGAGAAGLPPLANMVSAALGFLHDEPVLPLSLATLALALVRQVRRVGWTVRDPLTHFYAGGAGVVLLQIACVAKHPGNHYLVPALAAACVLTSQALASLQDGRAVSKLSGALTLVLAIMLVPRIVGWESHRFRLVAEADRAAASLEADAGRRGCRLAPLDPAPGAIFAMADAILYTRGHFLAELAAIHPDALYLDRGTGQFRTFAGAVPTESLKHDGRDLCVLTVNPPEGFLPDHPKISDTRVLGPLGLFVIHASDL